MHFKFLCQSSLESFRYQSRNCFRVFSPRPQKTMKPLFITALLTVSIFPAQAQHLEKDKVQHIVVSAGLGVVVAAAKPDWTSGDQFLVAMIPGVMKETYDARKGGTGFSGKDLLADAAGAFAGVQGWRWLVVPKAGGGAEVSWNTKF